MSGGIDSTACAHLLAQQGEDVDGIFIDYGQPAAKVEERAVTAITTRLGIHLAIWRVSTPEPFTAGELIGRNAFLIFAALFLTRARPGMLAMGVHSGTRYYDCSEPFVAALARLVAEHTDGRVSFVAPFANWSKRDIYEYFVGAGLPIDLTYSCEVGSEPACGKCTSCRDRKVLGC